MQYEIAMGLAFIVIFIFTHYIFKNIKDIFLWTCKIVTAVYLWLLLWILTQLHRLPEWQVNFKDSIYNLVELVNFTKPEL